MGRKLRTRLDLVFPSLQEHVKKQQYKTLERNGNQTVRLFTEGENILVRNYQGKDKRNRGETMEVLGSRHYIVKVPGGVWKEHIDQLLKDNEQTGGKSELDEAGISIQKTTSPIAEKTPEGSQGQENTSPVTSDGSNTDSCKTETSDTQPARRHYPLQVNQGRPDNKLKS